MNWGLTSCELVPARLHIWWKYEIVRAARETVGYITWAAHGGDLRARLANELGWVPSIACVTLAFRQQFIVIHVKAKSSAVVNTFVSWFSFKKVSLVIINQAARFALNKERIENIFVFIIKIWDFDVITSWNSALEIGNIVFALNFRA